MIEMTAVGYVHNEVKDPFGSGNRPQGWGRITSDLVLDDKYIDALDGIEDYSHVIVIFLIDRARAPESMKRHVQGRPELPVIGIFAGRAPHRPNPIGVTSVPIIAREGNVLRVQGLDAIDGTPILDLKPYTPAFDRVENARIPDHCRLLFEQEDYF